MTLAHFLLWLFPSLKPRRPGYAGMAFTPETGMKVVVDLTPASFDPNATIPIKKATITPIVNGTPLAPIDTIGPAVPVTVNVGDTISNTETFTNALGFTSDPSDPAPPLLVADPRPAKPAPASMAIVAVVPDATPAP